MKSLTKPELERRITLLSRAAERFPELCEAILLERSRLEQLPAKKRATRTVVRPVEAAA